MPIMNASSVRYALDDGHTDEPGVELRLSLMVPDEATGEPKLIASFLKRSSMPLTLASPNVSIAIEVHGERRVFKPTQVTWDDTRGVCIVEIEWLVTDAASHADAVVEDEPWPTRRLSRTRRSSAADRTSR
jgi:hypothetical protein